MYTLKTIAYKACLPSRLLGTHGCSFVAVVRAGRFVVLSALSDCCGRRIHLIRKLVPLRVKRSQWWLLFWKPKGYFWVFLPFSPRFFAPVPPIWTSAFSCGLLQSPEWKLMAGVFPDMSSFSFISIISCAFSSSLKVYCWLTGMIYSCFLEFPFRKDMAFVKIDTSLFRPSFTLTSLWGKAKWCKMKRVCREDDWVGVGNVLLFCAVRSSEDPLGVQQGASTRLPSLNRLYLNMVLPVFVTRNTAENPLLNGPWCWTWGAAESLIPHWSKTSKTRY